MTVEETDAQVAALEHELAGYEARGMTDRANEVRVEIARLSGTTVEVEARPARAQSTNRLAGKSKVTRVKKEVAE